MKDACAEPGEAISSCDNTKVVANHYNSIEEKGLKARFESPIFYMRNFNNWVKALLINDYLDYIKRNIKDGPIVLDICCGKGGDMFKWKMGSVKHVIFADIASLSIEDCKERYDILKKKSGHHRLFTAEFLVADCTKDIIKEQFDNPNIAFDMVSCQFAFHYSFESVHQANKMMKNISDNLRVGGYYVGTMPDAYDILQRIIKNNGKSVGNKVFNIELQFNPEEGIPLFGAKYNFHLEGVVDCPEFLVHFPTFVELANKYNLELVMKQRFEDYFKSHQETGRDLLQKMLCFQTYPSSDESSTCINDFSHAHAYLQENERNNVKQVGTISKSEWEAVSIYLVFAFKKKENK